MKKLLAAMLASCMLVSCASVIAAAESTDGAKASAVSNNEEKTDEALPKNMFGQNIIPPKNIDSFEGGYMGYVSKSGVYDDRDVRIIKRTGADNTQTGFNYYKWGPLFDGDGNYIPLSTANYIVIDYYYYSPDAEPALLGNKVKWIQGRITPETSISSITEFAWGTNLFSENGMVANKWDKLVIPLEGNPAIDTLKSRYSECEYYLHQMKMFPLERDMGKEDVLYFGNITVQSWNPNGESGISDRTVRFFNNAEDEQNTEKAILTITKKDVEYITLPEFTGTAPENTEFNKWRCTFDGKEYRVGSEYQLLAGRDINFVPVYNYVFDFSGLETAYINGYPDGTFLPQNNVTRAEACNIIASIVNPGKKDMGGTKFTDVAEDAWYYNAVTTLENLGALSIWSDTFDYNTPITRSELVEIVYAIADKDCDSMKLSYVSDVNADDRFYDAVMYAMSIGVIAGYEDGTFRPQNNITRAETVTIVNRFIGRVPNGNGENKFSDISDHWAKGQIIASASSKNENTWEISKAPKEYVLEGKSAKDYITSLHSQAQTLTGDAIRRGIDTISEQMKKDILSTPNTAEIYGDRMTGRTYYVSEKNGDDSNNGLSPEKAFKTIDGLKKGMRLAGKGTSVLFERGGIYRGQIGVTSGLTYGAYGEGDKPVISGSLKNYADVSLWKETNAKNVYELTDKLTNVGIIVFDHAADAHGNYDGLYGKNRIYEKNIETYAELTKDLEFFSCNDTLYLCSTEGNPGKRFSSIEMGTRVDVFDGGGNDLVFDNLHIKHTGSHGIGLGNSKNITVTNCEFSWLGGSLLGDYGQTTTQYGNSVEIFGSCDGYYVKNNWMYQIYDTAVTHQGNDAIMANIEYSGNLMEYVHWGIECWIQEKSKKCSFNNYLAAYNVLREGGYGWGSIVTNRQGAARLYSFSNTDGSNSDIYAEYNVIDRCAGYLLDIDKALKHEFDSNIYVQDEGKILGGLRGKGSLCSKRAAQDIYDNLKDENEVFVFIPVKS